MNTIVRVATKSFRSWYFAPLTRWFVPPVAVRMSSECCPYLVLRVGGRRERPAVEWVVEQAVAAAVPPPIAAVVTSCLGVESFR
jgi:hypothetical protein